MIFEETVVMNEPFDVAVERVKEAFAGHGFGTLTEIDMAATLKTKVGHTIDPHVILGFCNPHLAAQALDAVPQIGVLLPCNVVVRGTDGDVIVEALDPGLMVEIAEVDDLMPIADEARQLINKALNQLAH